MLDIVELNDGEDLKVVDSIVSKAGNVLSVQLGALEYAQDFGVDTRYFLESDFQIENSSFKSYCVQRLIEHQVNVSAVTELLDTLFEKYTFHVNASEDAKGFIR